MTYVEREDIEGKHIAKSPTMGALSVVAIANLVMIVQAVSTGGIGALLTLDPNIIAHGISIAGIVVAGARRLFSKNTRLYIRKK